MASKIIMGFKVWFQGEKYLNMVQFQKVKTYIYNDWGELGVKSLKCKILLLISIYNNIYF